VQEPDPQQWPLGLAPAVPDPADQPPLLTETVKAYQRRAPLTALATGPDESGLRFDAAVPVQEMRVPNPAVAALSPAAYEVMGEKVTYRLAQRPGAYVILTYIRPVVKQCWSAALLM
jgi:transposase